MNQFLAILSLVGLGAIDVAACIAFYLVGKYTKFSSLKYWLQQLIFGVVFGGLAILGSELGVQVDGVTMNVRDAAPLTAALLFGWPAGVIAGVIGGVERFISPFIGGNGGTYTIWACSVATVFSGVFGALLRRFMFDDKKASWYYCLSTGLMVEVFHMLLIFLTHMDDVSRAFTIVKQICWPMIAIVGFTVMAASLILSFLSREKLFHPVNEQRKLAQSFQWWLLVAVVLGFIATSNFTYFVQTRLNESNADSVLNLNLTDAKNDIQDTSDQNLLELTAKIKKAIDKESSSYPGYYTAGMTTQQMQDSSVQQAGSAKLTSIATNEDIDVSEINYVNHEGLIIYSNVPAYIGYDMNSGSQSAEFYWMMFNEKDESFVQDFGPISKDSTVWMKYASYLLSGGENFVQVGYNSARFQKDIDSSVIGVATNRHVGESGSMVIADETFTIVSDQKSNEGKSLSAIGLDPSQIAKEETATRYKGTLYGADSYYMVDKSEGYYIISILPSEEVTFGTLLSVYISVFMEVEVFAMLFIVIYFLVKHLVVNNIEKINDALGEITGGNLNVSVDVRGNEEFASLSDDINHTVITLKGYIKEAAERIDKELEFAKEIQLSALPAPLDGGKRFALYASMLTAKEVGGDFYDYFLLGEDKIALVIADVSGKGIPASLFMMKSKTLIKSLAESGETSPAKILEKANHELAEGNDAEMFVTVWLGLYDFNTHVLTTANAGHEFPAIRHQNGDYELFHDKHGFVLAGMPLSHYKEETITLMPGDQIFVYTDGVTEATSAANELFGETRLLAALNAAKSEEPAHLLPRMKEAIDAFVGSAPQFDDITMLSFAVKDPNALPNELTLSAIPENVEKATDFVNAHLELYHCPNKEKIQIDIAIDELFSNIARYAYNPEVGAATVRVETVENPLSVIVTFIDKGVPYDPLKKKDPDVNVPLAEREIGGLGIYMVKKSMDEIVYSYKNGQNILSIKKTIANKD
jgi:serine phosphatase RsbU (regulator of sigma subunit)/anti-sigma regulatory factor (Ser/Thr protein kinase)